MREKQLSTAAETSSLISFTRSICASIKGFVKFTFFHLLKFASQKEEAETDAVKKIRTQTGEWKIKTREGKYGDAKLVGGVHGGDRVSFTKINTCG